MLRVILSEGIYDRVFVAENVSGLEALQAAVEPFTPDYVERRAGVPAVQFIEAARIFATARCAHAVAGTGPNMAPRSSLNEYLIHALNTVCGRYVRAGEEVPNPYVLYPPHQAIAQPVPTAPLWAEGIEFRNGRRASVAGPPISGIADEILTPGEGQIRALISIGGNPMVAWPDPLKTARALADLELSVAIDIKLSATARRCDYVIAPKLSLEVPATTQFHETDVLITSWGGNGFPVPYAQYTPAVASPPPGADVIEEWEFFYGLARRMGLSLSYKGTPLDMAVKPTTDELLAIGTLGARVPLDEVKRHPHGAIFADPPIRVRPREPDCEARLDVGNAMMMAMLGEVASEARVEGAGYRCGERFGYRLISRRLRSVYNSSGRDIDALLPEHKYNPAFMNPADLAREGLASGDIVEIASAHGSLLAIVKADETVRSGAISMTHAFGDPPLEENDLHRVGSTTALLCSSERELDPISGMPLQSAVPVNVRRTNRR